MKPVCWYRLLANTMAYNYMGKFRYLIPVEIFQLPILIDHIPNIREW